MAISVVQTLQASGNPPWSFTSNVTAGNTVILIIDAYTTDGSDPTFSGIKLGGSTPTGTIPLFNSGTSASVISAASGGNRAIVSPWMLPNCPGGQKALDVGAITVAFIGAVAYEVAGLGASPSVDQSSSGSSITASTADSGTTPAITGAPEFIVAGSMIFSGAGASSPAGFTVVNPSGDQWAGYQIATSSGGTYDWSQTGAGQPWAAAIATIQGTPAAPTPSQVVLSAPYRPPPPPGRVPTQVITGPLPAPPAALTGIIQPESLPYLAPQQVAPQVITNPAVAAADVSASDTGTGADAAQVGVIAADAGAGADAAGLAASIPAADTAAGADAAQVGVIASDAGTGADAATAAVGIPAADSGTGADSAQVGIIAADAGAGADAAGLSATIPASDAGAGADGGQVGVSASDAGTGTDAATAAVGVPAADTGTGADAAGLAASIPGADAGTGADAAGLAASIPAADTAAGADAASVFQPGSIGQGTCTIVNTPAWTVTVTNTPAWTVTVENTA